MNEKEEEELMRRMDAWLKNNALEEYFQSLSIDSDNLRKVLDELESCKNRIHAASSFDDEETAILQFYTHNHEMIEHVFSELLSKREAQDE